ncbi:hypothetical protein Agub_g15059 [Astrephomene gubernaculifera]|uniref:Cytochrome c-553 n=1 Tax=Astrephomene gubernaculifera TaxID=47775 RepID=A0AAD3HSS1_9CHLO|nr:hypothetical protein Agub_g15059 [Astrephomene gubernaculifera]
MASLFLDRVRLPQARSTSRRKQRAQPKFSCYARSNPSRPTHAQTTELHETEEPLRAGPVPLLLAVFTTIFLSTPMVSAAEAPELFLGKCAGCHMNGGNVLAVGATLFPEAPQVRVTTRTTQIPLACWLLLGLACPGLGRFVLPADLRKNGLDSSEALYRIIYSGKGKMPGFGKECAPRGACTFGPRLSDGEVEELVSFVQQRAAEGWRQKQ